MIYPWFKHKNFEARMNTYYDELQDLDLMYVEIRKRSIIPFKRWQNWKHFSERPFRSFEDCLDELNQVKLYFLHEDVRSHKKKKSKNITPKWKEINLK